MVHNRNRLGTLLISVLFMNCSCEEIICAEQPYRYVLFEGGGVKGTAYAGAILALEEHKLMDNVRGFAGSSAGSQQAALMAARYTGEELHDVLSDMEYSDFMDTSSSTVEMLESSFSIINPFEDIWRLIQKFGFFKGEAIETVIDTLLAKKTGRNGTTFRELYEYSKMELRITATCVSTGYLEWFDRNNTPDMKVSRAVHASSAIPFVYEPVLHDGKMYVDGGCLRNLPHDSFPGLGSILAFSVREFGLLGVENLPNISNIVQFSAQLANTILFGPSSANSLILSQDSKNLDIIPIDFGDVTGISFGLTQEQKAQLMLNGYDAVIERLNICGVIEENKESGVKPQWYSNLLKIIEESNELTEIGVPKKLQNTLENSRLKGVMVEIDRMYNELEQCVNLGDEKTSCQFHVIFEQEKSHWVYKEVISMVFSLLRAVVAENWVTFFFIIVGTFWLKNYCCS
eukprot:snap_masked-scaffold_27-processed-gene-1.52-mRNA-1 protein AED:1.00 eAED:1.00 QI:0/-1/0/0/-1/1/1/0/457